MYSDPKFIANEDAINVWYELLKDMDAKVLMASVAKYMQTEKFPPFPADLRKVNEGRFLSGEEAWTIVSDALWACTSRTKAGEMFDKFPPEVQKTLGSADALYAYTQGEWNEGVNKALFIKSYNPTVENMKAENRMSTPLKTALSAAERIGIETRVEN